jgi:hypothetical protein
MIFRRAADKRIGLHRDFVDGLARLVRKTVRDYCTVGQRGGIDCQVMS